MDYIIINKNDYIIPKTSTILTKYYHINYYLYLLRIQSNLNYNKLYTFYIKYIQNQLIPTLINVSGEIYEIGSIVLQVLQATHNIPF